MRKYIKHIGNYVGENLMLSAGSIGISAMGGNAQPLKDISSIRGATFGAGMQVSMIGDMTKKLSGVGIKRRRYKK